MNNLKNFGKSILISGIAIPALGVLAHFVPGKDAFMQNDSSLAHRFESAYTFRVNPEHRRYTSYEYADHNPNTFVDNKGIQRPIDKDGNILSDCRIEPGEPFDMLYREEEYACNPYMIYPMHVLLAMGAYSVLRRRDEMMADEAYARLMRMKQRTR